MEKVTYDSPDQIILARCHCGNAVNCFEIPDDRYVKNGTCWVIECKDMGCILPRCGFYGYRDDLIEKWNSWNMRNEGVRDEG